MSSEGASVISGCGQPQTLQAAWIQFLMPYRWHWFCTMTFRDYVHPEAADKRFRYFVSKLNRMLLGPRWHKKPSASVYWARGLEYQRRNVLHFHALLGCAAKDLNHHAIRKYWEAVWNEMAGYARIDCVRSHKDAIRYVTKYVTKGGQIDLSPNLGIGGIRDELWDQHGTLAALSAHSA